MQNYQEQSPSPIRSLLSRLFDGWSVGGSGAPRTGSLSPETVRRGRNAMRMNNG